MFPAFLYHIQSNSTISALVDGNIIPNLLPSLVDSYLETGKQSCMVVTNTKETTALNLPGYKTQYKIKLDFVYTITIVSRISAAYVSEIGQVIDTLLNNNERKIVLEYGGSNYTLYIDPFVHDSSFVSETNYWQDIVTITGFRWLKEI
jgi:hypothetical protein